MTYKIIAETKLEHSSNTIVTLDKNKVSDDYNKESVSIDGVVYSYTPTHSMDMMVVNTADILINKNLQFV